MPFLAIDPEAAEDLGLETLGAPLADHGKSLLTMRGEVNMGMINRADLDASFYDARINDTYLDLSTSIKYKEIKRSVPAEVLAGQPFYLLSQAVRVLDSVSFTNTSQARGGGYLSKIDENTYRSYRDLDGDPQAYFVFGDVMVLYPTPNADRSMVLEVRIRPLLLVEDEDCPILPIEWHEGVVLKARQKAFSMVQEWEAASLAENEFVDFVRRRSDPSAEAEETKLVQSSVPRHKGQTTRLDVHYPR